MTARVPPYSEQAEQALCGSVLLASQDVFDACVAAGVSAATFYVPGLRAIWEAAATLGVRNAPIDVLTVSEELRRTGRMDVAGGQLALERCCMECVTSAHAGYYIRLCRDNELRRGVITTARRAEELAYDCQDAEEVRSRSEYEMAALRQAAADRRTFRDLVRTQMEAWEQAQRSGSSGIRTGFDIVDRYCGGLQPAAYIVISGGPGCGKTTLARNIAENLAMRGLPVEMFSLEQTGEQIAGATAARVACQSVFWLNMGSRRCDLGKLVAGAGIVSDWPLTIHDQGITRTMLWSECRRAVSKRGAKLIVLDYLQAVRDDGDSRRDTSEAERISHTSATCREIAKELRVPLIAVSALSNSGVLRGSGMIAYDCWAHVRLQAAADWSAENLSYTATFEKQRFGPPGAVVSLRLIGDEQRFEEVGAGGADDRGED